MAIIYSDPLYAPQAHRALRRERRSADRQTALDALTSFLTNAAAGRQQRRQNASQSRALSYYGRAMAQPDQAGQIGQDMVMEAQKYGQGPSFTESPGAWLYSKAIGGNEPGIDPSIAMGILPHIAGIPGQQAEIEQRRAATEVDRERLVGARDETALARERLGFERDELKHKKLLRPNEQRDSDLRIQEGQARLDKAQLDIEHERQAQPFKLEKLRREASGYGDIEKTLEEEEKNAARHGQQMARLESALTSLKTHDPAAGISPMLAMALSDSPKTLETLKEAALIPDVKARQAVIDESIKGLSGDYTRARSFWLRSSGTADALRTLRDNDLKARYGDSFVLPGGKDPGSPGRVATPDEMRSPPAAGTAKAGGAKKSVARVTFVGSPTAANLSSWVNAIDTEEEAAILEKAAREAGIDPDPALGAPPDELLKKLAEILSREK